MIFPSRLLVSDIKEDTPLFRRRESIVTLGDFRRDVACLVQAIRQSGAGSAVLHADDNYDFAVGLLACLYAEIRTILPGNLCENTRARLEASGTIFVHELSKAEAPADATSSLQAVSMLVISEQTIVKIQIFLRVIFITIQHYWFTTCFSIVQNTLINTWC